MGTADKLLDKMKNNPHDWRIETLLSVAEKYGIEVRNHGGSHYVFSVADSELAVTVPAHRPIKPVYFRQFLLLVEQVKGKRS